MKPLVAVFAFVCCAAVAAPARADTSAPSPGAPSPGVLHWRTDEAAATREAAKTNRPLLAFFSAEWCMPCHEMLTRSFTDRDVAAIVAKRFVPLLVDVTAETPATTALRDRYHVDALPTLIARRGKAPDLLRLDRFVDAAALRAALERSLR
jgi:protein disulfide-isomerase